MNLRITIVKPLLLFPERLRHAVVAVMHESMALLETAIRQRTPVGVGGQSGLRGSIAGEVREYATTVQGIVSTPLRYGMPVEYGRRAGQAMPPVAALIPWVERTITLKKGESAKGVAFAIARYMARHGTRAARKTPPGERMFERGVEAARPQIERAFARKVGEAVARTME